MRKMNRNEIFLFIKHNRNIIIRCCCCYCCRSGSILILCLILILSRICCITFFSFKDIIQSTYLRHSFYPLIRIPLFFSFKKGADKIKFDHHHIVVTYGLEFFLMVVVVKKKNYSYVPAKLLSNFISSFFTLSLSFFFFFGFNKM